MEQTLQQQQQQQPQQQQQQEEAQIQQPQKQQIQQPQPEVSQEQPQDNYVFLKSIIGDIINSLIKDNLINEQVEESQNKQNQKSDLNSEQQKDQIFQEQIPIITTNTLTFIANGKSDSILQLQSKQIYNEDIKIQSETGNSDQVSFLKRKFEQAIEKENINPLDEDEVKKQIVLEKSENAINQGDNTVKPEKTIQVEDPQKEKWKKFTQISKRVPLKMIQQQNQFPSLEEMLSGCKKVVSKIEAEKKQFIEKQKIQKAEELKQKDNKSMILKLDQ